MISLDTLKGALRLSMIMFSLNTVEEDNNNTNTPLDVTPCTGILNFHCHACSP